MPAPAHSDRGQGPVVVLLHGVGVGPESFAPVAELLEDRHRVVVLARPGGTGGRAWTLADQADHLAMRLRELGAAGGRLVGTSGGATVGLLLGLRHPEVVAGLILHEPLLGPLVPELHQRFERSAALAATSEAAAMDVVRSVMGTQTWDALDPSTQAASTAQAARWRREIPTFATFVPTTDELATLRALPVLTTVGSRSGPERHAAAAVLARWSGAEVAEVPDAGNAAQIDAPEALAQLIATWHTLPVGDRP